MSRPGSPVIPRAWTVGKITMHPAKPTLGPEPRFGLILLLVFALAAPTGVIIAKFVLSREGSSSPPSGKTQYPDRPGGGRESPPYFQGPLLYGLENNPTVPVTNRGAGRVPSPIPWSKVPRPVLTPREPNPVPVSLPVNESGRVGNKMVTTR